MKKKLVAVCVIIVVALSVVCAVLLLQKEPETVVEVANAKITEVECDGVGYNNGQEYRVQVTVTNYETHDVEGLTVSVRDGSNEISSGNTQSVGLIEAGSTKTVTVSGNYSWLQKADVFILMYNGEFLDEEHRGFSAMRAKITKIDWDETGYHRGNEYEVEVTVTNYEAYDIEGLKVSVRDESDDIRSASKRSVGLIEAGSTKTVTFGGSYSWLQGLDIVTLLFDDEVLDEQYYGFSKWLP